jgi:hypothetical protein
MQPKLFILLVSLLVCVVACSDRAGKPVHFSLPEDFRGVFRVVVDEREGVLPMDEGVRLVFAVPAHGTVVIKDVAFLAGYRTYTATIGVTGRTTSLNQAIDDDLFFYPLHASSEGDNYWLIGTPAEYDLIPVLNRPLPLARQLTASDRAK